MEVLNTTLYKALVRCFGKVQVVNRDIAIEWHVARHRVGQPCDRREVTCHGEQYMVNCPFCNDTRQRLGISHRWAVPDPELDTKNLWLFRCFNEECQGEEGNPQRLFEMVFPLCGPQLLNRMIVKPGKAAATRPIEMAPPGPMTRLDRLEERHPQHHALIYLRSRFFDPCKLAKYYGVSYCMDSEYRFARDRVIFPVYMNKLLVGWQARFIGDNVFGRSFKDAGVPKYYGCPGMAKRVIAFNFDWATRHPTVVIVEGPTDVANFGVQAMGIMGKSVNMEFQKKICSLMKRRWGADGVIVVMLDPDQDAVAKRKGRPHHIEVLVKGLRQYHPRVLPVYLPAGYDPGSYDYRMARDVIREAAAREGFHVSFGKPPAVHDEKRAGPGRLRKYAPRS